jgi:DNA-binding NarL/FixJ family response regulator
MGIRVIIADDYPGIRRVLSDLIEGHPDMKIVGEAKDGKDAIECCLGLVPDIAIVDVHMPGLNGIEAAHQIVRQLPRVKVLALSGDPDLRYVRRMLTAGASGYVLKDFMLEELVDAVRTIAKGGTYLSSKIKREIIAALCDGTESPSGIEEEVLRGLAEGKCICDIALDLNIIPKKVYETRQSIADKIVVSDVVDLAGYIIRDGTD